MQPCPRHGGNVRERTPHQHIVSKSTVPGIYTSNGPVYTDDDYRRDAELFNIELDPPPPPCLTINTVRDQYAPADDILAGTYLRRLPQELFLMIRHYWASGKLPDTYRLAGVIAQRPALLQWYHNMLPTWEDGSRYTHELHKCCQDDHAISAAEATCYVNDVPAIIAKDNCIISVQYGARTISLTTPDGVKKMGTPRFVDNRGTIYVDVTTHEPSALGGTSSWLENNGTTYCHYTGYRIHNVLDAPRWEECCGNPIRPRTAGRNSLGMVTQLLQLNRCHYMRHNDICTEYLGAVPLRTALVPQQTIYAIDSTGCFLASDDTNMVRIVPAWISPDLVPTVPADIIPYPDLLCGDYVYSPDGTLYAIHVRFTRMYRNA